jgi:catalase
MDAATRAAAAPDYLEQELKRRLAEGPVRWNMVVIVAASDDPTDDPTHAWPEDRERVVVGDVVVHDTLPAGACRDVNFDPLILPQGVRPSGDPVLHARSAVYSESAKRRLRETAAQSSASAAP